MSHFVVPSPGTFVSPSLFHLIIVVLSLNSVFAEASNHPSSLWRKPNDVTVTFGEMLLNKAFFSLWCESSGLLSQ